tara:strand:+ start:5147 stop:5599 length:453 start_codon:yes stop_codon:yes gene_type:complete
MIRMLEEHDIPTVLLKGRAMHEESPVFNPSKYDDKKVEDLLNQSLTDHYNICVLLAEEKGQIVGGIIAMAYGEFYGPERTASDLVLFIDKDKRGGLTAARLIKAYESWAKLVDVSVVTLGVSTGINPERTSSLYKKLGYGDVSYSYRKRI